MRRKIAAFTVATATIVMMIGLGGGAAVAYDHSGGGTNLLPFMRTPATVAVSTQAAASFDFMTLAYTSGLSLGGVTTYDPQITSSTGTLIVFEAPTAATLVDNETSIGTITFTFSQPVVNPHLHIVAAGSSISLPGNAIQKSTAWSLTNTTGTWTALAGFDGYTTDPTHVTFPGGVVNTLDGTHECVPQNPGDLGQQCGSLEINGVVTSLTIQIDAVSHLFTTSPQDTSLNAGSAIFAWTIDETLAGTALTDVPLASSYQTAGSAITDLRLGSQVAIWGADTMSGATPEYQPQKSGVDGVATVPDVLAGQPVTVNAQITGASKTPYTYAWIDLDGNGTYDDNERVAGVTNGTDVTFTFPASMTQGATGGESFMRVRTGYTDAQASSPSGWSDSGEVEDYSIMVYTPPAITTPADGSHTSNPMPTLVGTGNPNDVIAVENASGQTLCTATVGTAGTWTCTPSIALTEGTNDLTPIATNADVGTLTGTTITVTLDTISPNPPQFTGPEPGLTNDNTPTFTGTGDPGDTLTVTDETGATVCTATIGLDGTWSCAPTTPIPDGEHTFTPTAKDAAGNTATGGSLTLNVDTAAPVTPIITAPADGSTGDNPTPTFQGTGENGTTMDVLDAAGNTVCSAKVASQGTWACTPTTPLPAGTGTYAPRSTDAAGNTTTGPSITYTYQPADAPLVVITPTDGSTTGQRPTFAGTGEPGARIDVTNGATIICTTTVATSGSWSCTPTSDLPTGSLTYTVTMTDTGGRVLSAGPITITVTRSAVAATGAAGPEAIALALLLTAAGCTVLLARRRGRTDPASVHTL